LLDISGTIDVEIAVEVVSNGAYAAFDRRKPPEYRPGDG
jgi:hypothetical protein